MRGSTLLFVAVCLICSCAGRQGAGRGNSSRIPDKTFHYSGGEGDTYETAVVIENAGSQSETAKAEYAFIGRRHGGQGDEWEVAGQNRTTETGKTYDIIEVRLLPSGDSRYFYFDVTKTSWQSK